MTRISLTLRIPPELADAIAVECQWSGESQNAAINRLLAAALGEGSGVTKKNAREIANAARDAVLEALGAL